MNDERFSKRHGYGPEEAAILIRYDAPEEVRSGILSIARGELELQPSFLRYALCTVLRKIPDQANWSEYPNIWGECQQLIEDAPWYQVYDFVEALYQELAKSQRPERAKKWAELINEYFLEAGVGWRIVGGQFESRGAEEVGAAVDTARNTLESVGLQTARQEIHEALRDLSRRPNPDLTGAIQHGMAALECTAREVTNDKKATLGELIKHNPDLFPKPLDTALAKMWGYASETGRHLREGHTPARAEAELMVGVASSCCSYLASQFSKGKGS